MIEEYLNQRSDILTEKKNKLKDSLLEIRSSLRESKRELDEYESASPKPFEPFSPRRDDKIDNKLSEINDSIKSLYKQFESVSSELDNIESEIKTVSQCQQEYKNVIARFS